MIASFGLVFFFLENTPKKCFKSNLVLEQGLQLISRSRATTPVSFLNVYTVYLTILVTAFIHLKISTHKYSEQLVQCEKIKKEKNNALKTTDTI